MKKLTRIENWLSEQLTDLTGVEIAAGLGNGDIEKPDWLCVSESADHMKIWDIDTGSDKMGFYPLPYN